MKPPALERKPGGDSVGHSENDIEHSGASSQLPTGPTTMTTTVAENTWGVIVRKYGDFFAYDDQLEGGGKSGGGGNNNTNSEHNEHLNVADNQLTSGPKLHSGEEFGGSGSGTLSSESTTTTGDETASRLKPTPNSILVGEQYSSDISVIDPTSSNLLRSGEVPLSGSNQPRSSRILAVPQAQVVFGGGPTSRTMQTAEAVSSSPSNNESSGGGGGITRWTRASTYLRNRTAALFNRLWTAHSHHSPVVVLPGSPPPPPPPLQTPLPPLPPPLPPSPPSLPSPSPQLSAYPSHHPHHPQPQLIEPDGMNILTDYSTLAYYILSNPNTAIVTSQQMPPIDHSGGKYPSN